MKICLSVLFFFHVWFCRAFNDVSTIPFNKGFSHLFGDGNILHANDDNSLQLHLNQNTGKHTYIINFKFHSVLCLIRQKSSKIFVIPIICLNFFFSNYYLKFILQVQGSSLLTFTTMVSSVLKLNCHQIILQEQLLPSMYVYFNIFFFKYYNFIVVSIRVKNSNLFS